MFVRLPWLSNLSSPYRTPYRFDIPKRKNHSRYYYSAVLLAVLSSTAFLCCLGLALTHNSTALLWVSLYWGIMAIIGPLSICFLGDGGAKQIRSKLRNWRRRFLIKYHGAFLQVYPVRCPKCQKRSWDPIEVRKERFNTPTGRGRNRPRLYDASNWYKCGHHVKGIHVTWS